MKVTVVGRQRDEILTLANRLGFIIVENNPDYCISYGGDGTIMRSEAEYPEVPKIILKNSQICKLCSSLSNEEVLKKVVNREYEIAEYMKIKVSSKGISKEALNDVTIHNADPRHAIRYKFIVNSKELSHEIIGDGIVASTPLGSTGYYRSITDSFFELGIGLAFNNSTEQSDHMVLNEESKIDIEITRGPANIYADNQVDFIELSEGDKVRIEKSDKSAKILKII